ncbi:MAG: caspase family protein [Agriterribacter sp.]
MSEKLNLNNAYGLLIGVGGENMSATVADAKALFKILTDKKLAAYPEKNVFLLTESKATRENVIKHLDLIAKNIKDKQDATVFIYYSGHGGRFEKAVQGKQAFDYYMLTHGFDLDNPKDTMLNGDDFSEMIDQLAAEKIIVLLDCCHAAGMKRKGVITKTIVKTKKKVTYSNEELIRKLKGGTGRVFMSSCADSEESVILPGAINSLFTQITLEALTGIASKGSSFVRVIDLMYHVLLTVPKKVAPYNHEQNPVINDVKNLNAGYLLCLNGKKATVKSGSEMIVKSHEATEKDKMNFIANYTNKISVAGNVTNSVTVNTINGDFIIGTKESK